jgi:hypothetical protein
MSAAKVQFFLKDCVHLIAFQMELRNCLMCAHIAASVQAFKHKIYAAQFHFCLWTALAAVTNLISNLLIYLYIKWSITYDQNKIIKITPSFPALEHIMRGFV